MSQTTSMTPMTTFDASVELNQSVEKQMAAAMAVSTTRMVEFLASEYGFNAAEAIQRLGLDSVTVSRPMKKKAAAKAPKAPKEKRMVPSIPLPFCGVVRADWCCGLRLNHGLYSQCTMSKGKDIEFCKTCLKQVEKSENNKPTYGVIQDRMSVEPMEFRDPKGKAVVCYGNVMAKLKIEKETAIAEAAKFDLVIPEEQFEERKTSRGRPKKDASASDTESDTSEKKRGRPKKNKVVKEAPIEDDLIANLVAQANHIGPSSDGSESDSSVRSVKSDVSVSSVKSAVSTNSTGSQKKVKKAKTPKPELTDEEKAAKKAATAAKRAATLAAKPELTDEEKAVKKAATAAKRAATWAAKAAKASKEADMSKPAAIIGVTVPANPVTVVPAPVAPAVPVFQAELVEEVVSDSEDDADMDVKEFTHDGVTYFYDAEEAIVSGTVLYDTTSQMPIGVWNDGLKKVDDYDASVYEQIPVV
jgi:hypothetical protein